MEQKRKNTGSLLKNREMCILFFFIIFLTNFAMAYSINPFFYSNNGEVIRIDSYSQIVENKLYTEIFITARILNKSLIEQKRESYFVFSMRSIEGNTHRNINLIEVLVCDDIVYPQGDYLKMSFNCLKDLEFINLSVEKDTLGFKLNLSEMSSDYGFSMKISYFIEDFIILNGDYKIAWIDTICGSDACPVDDTNIRRYLMLPSSNSIIESWNNFNIVGGGNGKRWVLKIEKNGESMVWYRNAKQEERDRLKRDIFLIALSLSLSLIFGLIFSDKKLTKRTRNLYILAGASLLIASWILLSETGGNLFWVIILILSMILFFPITIIAILSGIKDKKGSSIKRNLRVIWKFIKKDILKY